MSPSESMLDAWLFDMEGVEVETLVEVGEVETHVEVGEVETQVEARSPQTQSWGVVEAWPVLFPLS